MGTDIPSVLLTDEQRKLLADTEKLAAEVFGPLAERGQDGVVDRPLVAALAEHGLLPRIFAHDATAMELCLIREGLARYCTAAETAFALQGLGAYPILQSGRVQPQGGQHLVPELRHPDV